MKELTFNLDVINDNNFKILKPLDALKILEKQMYITATEFDKIMITSFETTSTELRAFIEETFGISFLIGSEHYSHHRNQLNRIIKTHKITQTKQGQRSTINYIEYKNIITSDEFIKFINSNLEKDNKVPNQKKMYEELMYLQVNKYHQTSTYKQKNYIKNNTLAFALEISTNLAETIRKCYALHLQYPNGEYKNFNIEDKIKTILDITKYRFIQDNIIVYKYDSEDDIYTTNDQQIIRHFIEDVDRWNNNITDGSLS